MANVRHEIMTVTPELAAAWLKRNIENNRNLRGRVIQKYAMDMKNGDWQMTGVPVVFNRSGKLIDGQHRLNAIVRSNTPVQMMVVRGVSDDTSIYDRGANRSIRDVLNMSGVKVENLVVSIINGVFALDFHTISGTVTDSMIRAYYEQEGDMVEKVIKIVVKGRGKSKSVIRNKGCALAVYHALACGVNEDDLNDFATAVNTGFYNPGESSAIVLKNFLSDPMQNKDLAGYEATKLCATEQAIRDFIAKVDRKMRYKTGDNLFVYRDTFIRKESALVNGILNKNKW